MDPEFSLHLAIIDSYVAAWHNGDLPVADKRRLIAAENTRYYGRPDAVIAWGKLVTEFAGLTRRMRLVSDE